MNTDFSKNQQTNLTTRRTPDYVGDSQEAKTLATRLQQYYHRRGFTNVRCWIEPELSRSGRKIWGVRSNIVFVTPKLHD